MSSEVEVHQDENENITERQELETEITGLLDEINKLKQTMFELYNQNKDNAAFGSYNESLNAPSTSKTICVPGQSNKKPTEPPDEDKMISTFYDRFVKILFEPKSDTVRFSFPSFGKTQYGLQFKCMAAGDQYTLDKCLLPQTFNMSDHKQNSYPVEYDEIPKYVEIVMENINAYSLRQKQVEELISIANKRLTITHSPCYTDIDISFKIVTLDSNTKKCVNVNLFYPLLHILPWTLEVNVEGDILLKRYLEAIFAVFKEEPLPKAYQQAFVNSDQMKFFA